MAKQKYIESPEKLWELFEAYRREVKSKPRIRYVLAQKLGEMIPEPLERPLTIDGFKAFGHQKGFTLKHYLENTEGAYEEYCTICTRVKDEIRSDQIEGGMVGQYNPSITQRLNGLTEKQEVDHSTKGESLNKTKLDISRLSKEEKIAVLKAIRDGRSGTD